MSCEGLCYKTFHTSITETPIHSASAKRHIRNPQRTDAAYPTICKYEGEKRNAWSHHKVSVLDLCMEHQCRITKGVWWRGDEAPWSQRQNKTRSQVTMRLVSVKNRSTLCMHLRDGFKTHSPFDRRLGFEVALTNHMTNVSWCWMPKITIFLCSWLNRSVHTSIGLRCVALRHGTVLNSDCGVTAW